MKRKNEKMMISFIKKLLPKAKALNPRIATPDLLVRDNIFVDYYLEVENRKIILEYNGHQHYHPVVFGGQLNEARQKYVEQAKRDQWLRIYCKKNNILLIEVDGRLVRGSNIKVYLINVLNREKIANLALK